MRTRFTPAVQARAVHDFSLRLQRGGVRVGPARARLACEAFPQAPDRRTVLTGVDAAVRVLAAEGDAPGRQLVMEAAAAFYGARNWDALCAAVPRAPAGSAEAALTAWRVRLWGSVRHDYTGLHEDDAYDRAIAAVRADVAGQGWKVRGVSALRPGLDPDGVAELEVEVVERASDDDPSRFVGFEASASVEVSATGEEEAVRLALEALAAVRPEPDGPASR